MLRRQEPTQSPCIQKLTSRAQHAFAPQGWDPRTPATDPAFQGPPPLADQFGPYLRFGNFDAAAKLFSISVMSVVHQSRSPYAPTLKYRCGALAQS